MRTFLASLVWLYLFCGFSCLATGSVEIEGFTQEEIMVVQEILSIRAAQMDHHANSKAHTFASSLNELHSGEKTNGLSFIDAELATGQKNGYRYRVKVNDKALYEGLPRWRSWSLEVKPVEYGVTGTQSFFCDVTATIRAGDINGEWGNPSMSIVPETVVCQINESFISEKGQTTHPHDTKSKPAKQSGANHNTSKASHENSALSGSDDALQFSQVIEEIKDPNGTRVWRVVGVHERGNLWKKTKNTWKHESEIFQVKAKNISSKGSGSVRGRFCCMVQNNCLELEWGGEYAGIPHVKLFPADPVLMHQLSDLYNPVIPKTTKSIISVFAEYEKNGQFRNLVKKDTTISNDGSFVFSDVPEGEWIVIGYLECEGKTWFIENQIPRYCDTWVLFVNTEANKTTDMENFYFGNRSNGLIACQAIY